ncbi:hypothetical protein ACOBV8_05975 [Pseudoalteromonas espejiana]
MALTDFKSVNEVPVYIKENKMTETELLPLRQSIEQIIDNLSYNDLSFNDPSLFIASANRVNDSDWVDSFFGLNDEQTIKKLNSAHNSLSQGPALDNLKGIINEAHPLNSKVLLAFCTVFNAYKILHHGNYLLSKNDFTWGIFSLLRYVNWSMLSRIKFSKRSCFFL